MTHMSRKASLTMGIATAFGFLIVVFPVLTGCDGSDRSAYIRTPAITDPERRTEPLSDVPNESLDLSAFAGMPDDYSRTVADYIEAVLNELQAAPLMRERYYHVDRSGGNGDRRFPDDANPMLDQKVPVSLLALPRPDVVHSWVKSKQARESGWREMEDTLGDAGTVYGRTLIFKAGERSEEPDGLPAAPMGTRMKSKGSGVFD